MNEFRAPTQLLQGITCTLGLEQDEGVQRLAEEIHVVHNPWDADNFEFALCRGELFWADTFFVAAGGAGFRSIIQIQNDSTDYLVRIDSVWVDVTVGTGYQLGRTATLATGDNGLIATARDGRYPRPSVPAVRWRSQNGVALPAGFSNGMMWDVIYPVANGTQEVRGVLPIYLRPQGTFAIWNNTDNGAIRANISGSVRRATTQRELNP